MKQLYRNKIYLTYVYAVVILTINQSNTLDSQFFKHDDGKELIPENGISITDMGKMSIYLLIVNY